MFALVLCTIGLSVTAEAGNDSVPGPVEIPGTDYALDPVNPGQLDEVEEKEQPLLTWPDGSPRLPYWDPIAPELHWFQEPGQAFEVVRGFARPPGQPTPIKRVIIAAGGKHENNGASHLYVAAGGENRLRRFDAVNLKEDLASWGPCGAPGGPCPTAGSPTEKWESIQSVAYRNIAVPSESGTQWKGEVFVLGRFQGKQRIRVFDEHGVYQRDLAALPDFLGPFEGMAAAHGELWLTSAPAKDGYADLLGQRVLMVDALTGAIKGFSIQPLADKDHSEATRNWWDISIAPELQAGIVDKRVFGRGEILPGLITPDSPLCIAAAYYSCASTNQRGTDAVPGMRWFLELPSYAEDGTNRPVREYSIDDRSTVIDATLLRQLLGDAITIDHPGHYLTPKREWITKQQQEGDTVSISDLIYNSRDVRIDWYGLLKDSDEQKWVRGRKCVGYIVSEADIYVVGDRGERWYELAKNFKEIKLYVSDFEGNYREFDSSTEPAGHDLCIDTTSPEAEFENGPHKLKLVAALRAHESISDGLTV